MLIMTLIFIIFLATLSLSKAEDTDFIFNGFSGANLSIDGASAITPAGLLQLTSTASQTQIGHAFSPLPLSFRTSTNGKEIDFSFSTAFVFAIIPENRDLSGNGLAFVISPDKKLRDAQPSQYLGIFNISNNGNPLNHIVAVEFDTIVNYELGDINDNHVGIDVNSLKSLSSHPAGYFSDENGAFTNLSLKSGEEMQAWVEYDGGRKQLNVTLAPIEISKPSRPLLSASMDLSKYVLDSMYVGFSSATGTIQTSHYLLGWSFKMNGEARPIEISALPLLPRSKTKPMALIIAASSATGIIVLLLIACVGLKIRRRSRFVEVLEEWERVIGAHRIPYHHLHEATKGFGASQVIGEGGFGKVYKGLLPVAKTEVAVKKVSHASEEGLRQFVAEITSLGRIRHPSFVELLGYCRRKGELLLVYEFMKNGSMERFLYDLPESTLSWPQRFQIIKQVASGLFYLHERWTHTILHRDIKASNVLLDDSFNGRLGDFGLSRLYEHGSDPHTTRLVGTVGYMAPELLRTGKATKNTDVYAFGTFMLEVVCGRRPMENRAAPDRIMLLDWVAHCLREGRLLEVVDPKLGRSFGEDELGEQEMVLQLGLLCSRDSAAERPTMEQVVQLLNRDFPLPEVAADGIRASDLPRTMIREDLNNYTAPCPSPASVSILFCGR